MSTIALLLLSSIVVTMCKLSRTHSVINNFHGRIVNSRWGGGQTLKMAKYRVLQNKEDPYAFDHNVQPLPRVVSIPKKNLLDPISRVCTIILRSHKIQMSQTFKVI